MKKITFICLLLASIGCRKESAPTLDLNAFNGRWAQVHDTSAHFYVDSLTDFSAVVRWPQISGGGLGAYSRTVYTVRVSKDTVFLTAFAIPGKYTLYKKGPKHYGFVFLQNMDRVIEAIPLLQIDNNTDQPGPDPIKPL